MNELNYQFFTQPSSLWADVRDLRLAVFVKEMQVPAELEIDEFDKVAIHLAVKDQGSTIGTLRLQKKENIVKLGRVAVHADYRRQGIGRFMMLEAIRYCETTLSNPGKPTPTEIVLGAQTYITDFYQALGFKERGDIFDDAGIPHIEMYRRL